MSLNHVIKWRHQITSSNHVNRVLVSTVGPCRALREDVVHLFALDDHMGTHWWVGVSIWIGCWLSFPLSPLRLFLLGDFQLGMYCFICGDIPFFPSNDPVVCRLVRVKAFNCPKTIPWFEPSLWILMVLWVHFLLKLFNSRVYLPSGFWLGLFCRAVGEVFTWTVLSLYGKHCIARG